MKYNEKYGTHNGEHCLDVETDRQTDRHWKKSEVCITDHWEIIDWTNLTFLPSSNTCSPFAL